MIWAGILALGLAASGGVGSGNPSLAKAEKLLDDLDYEGAALALVQAGQVPGNDRRTVLRILELQGAIAAALDRAPAALGFFRKLLSLAPDFALSKSKYSAEQRAPFDQARSELASTGPLRFEIAPARARPGLVESVVVRVASDSLALGKKVRFSLKIGDGPWKQSVVPLAEGRASAPVDAEEVSFSAELLGDFDAQLVVIASREKPVVLRAPANLDAMDGPALDLGGYRPFAIAAGAAGVAAAVAGAYFGSRSAEISGQVAAWRAEQQSQGRVTSVSQAEARRLVDEANTNAVIADSLFAGAAVLGGAGAALWFIEPQKAPGEKPGPGGLRLEVRWSF